MKIFTEILNKCSTKLLVNDVSEEKVIKALEEEVVNHDYKEYDDIVIVRELDGVRLAIIAEKRENILIITEIIIDEVLELGGGRFERTR